MWSLQSLKSLISELSNIGATVLNLNTYTWFKQLGITEEADYTVPNVVSALPIGSIFIGSLYDFFAHDSNLASQIGNAYGFVTIKKYKNFFVEITITLNGGSSRMFYYSSNVNDIVNNSFAYHHISFN